MIAFFFGLPVKPLFPFLSVKPFGANRISGVRDYTITMVLSETLTETIPDGTDEVDRVSLIALDGFLPYPVPAESVTGEHYTEDKEAEPTRLSTIDDYR